MKFWDMNSCANVFSSDAFSDKVTLGLWDASRESCVIGATADGKIHHFDARAKNSSRTLQLKNTEVECAIQLGDQLLIGTEAGTLVRVDLGSMKLLPGPKVAVHSKAVMGLAAVADDKIVTAGADGVMKCLNLSNLESVSEVKTKVGQLFGASVCPHDPYLVAFGSSEGEAVIWNVENIIKNKSTSV